MSYVWSKPIEVMKKRIFDELPLGLKIEAIHDFGSFIGDFSENGISYSLFLMSSYYLEIRYNTNARISEINTYNSLSDLHESINEMTPAA